MKTVETNARVRQMESHGVDRNRYAFASFCFGRGWRGHRTAEAARVAAARDAKAARASFGGGAPQAFAARTDTGEPI
jgi:hypothetical protein